MRHTNRRPGHHEHRVLHLQLHREIFPVDTPDRRRERQELRHGLGDRLLHIGVADWPDQSGARTEVRQTVPEFLSAVHSPAALHSQRGQSVADESERLPQSVAATTLARVGCVRRSGRPADRLDALPVVHAGNVDVAVGRHRLQHGSHSQGVRLPVHLHAVPVGRDKRDVLGEAGRLHLLHQSVRQHGRVLLWHLPILQRRLDIAVRER